MRGLQIELESIQGEVEHLGEERWKISHWFYQMNLFQKEPYRGGLYLFVPLDKRQEAILMDAQAMGLGGFHVWHPIAESFQGLEGVTLAAHTEVHSKAPLTLTATSSGSLLEALKFLEKSTVDLSTVMLEALEAVATRYELPANPSQENS